MPHPETAAKTTATTEILSTSCKGGERPEILAVIPEIMKQNDGAGDQDCSLSRHS